MLLRIFSEIAVLDDQAVIWLNQLMFRWPPVDAYVEWFLNANILKFVPMVLVVCWLWFDRTPEQEYKRHILVEAILISFAALFVARFLALALPFRNRPISDLNLVFNIPYETGLRTWSSFPSDHAIMAFALAASLFRLSPKFGLWAFFHAAIFICLPRLLLGLHYPSDLIGGGLIGITLGFLVSQLPRRHAVTGLVLKIECKHPAMFYALAFLILFEISEMFDSCRTIVAHIFRFLKLLLV